jgi:cytidine deaminase
MMDGDLLARAKHVRLSAYAPYSRFLVGAAIEDEQGQVHVGCNVENGAYPLGACAEAGAIGAMIAAGGKRIARIAIVGGHTALEACSPCGGCRQRIAEFADGATRIVLEGPEGVVRAFSLAALLPASFTLDTKA